MAVHVGVGPVRAGVEGERADRRGPQAGLLADLADGAVGDRLTQLHRAGGHRPVAVVGALDQQEPPGVVADHGPGADEHQTRSPASARSCPTYESAQEMLTGPIYGVRCRPGRDPGRPGRWRNALRKPPQPVYAFVYFTHGGRPVPVLLRQLRGARPGRRGLAGGPARAHRRPAADRPPCRRGAAHRRRGARRAAAGGGAHRGDRRRVRGGRGAVARRRRGAAAAQADGEGRTMSRADDIKAAQESLDSRDWSGAVVDNSAPTTKVTMSARYPSEIARRVMEDAQARGLKPGAILREIVEAHYATLDAVGDEPITVRPADVVRALTQVARRKGHAAA